MITNLSLKIEVESGADIYTISKEAMEMLEKMQVPLTLQFEKGDIWVDNFSTPNEIVENFREL